MTKEQAEKIVQWMNRKKPTFQDYGTFYKMEDVIQAYEVLGILPPLFSKNPEVIITPDI